MTFKNHVLIPILIILSFSSCRIEKKLYSKGYHITSKKSYATTSTLEKEDKQLLDRKDKQPEVVDPIINITEQKEEAQSEGYYINTSFEDSIKGDSPAYDASVLSSNNDNHQYTQQVKTFVFPKSAKRIVTDYNEKELKRLKILSIAGFILSLTTIFSFGIGPTIALIFGTIVLKKTSNRPTSFSKPHKILSIIGTIIGALWAIVFSILIFFIWPGSPAFIYILATLSVLTLLTCGIILLTSKKTDPSINPGENPKAFAFSSFILGLLAIPTFGMTGILSILFGAIAYNRFDNNPEKGQKNRWMAGIGFALGLISCILLITVGIADLAGFFWSSSVILPVLGLFALASFIASFIIRS